MTFRAVNDTSVVAALFTAANYTYGPLLGLFFFGILFKSKPREKLIPFVAIASPVICYLLEYFLSKYWGFSFGFSLLPVNGAITMLGLALLPRK